MVLKFCPIKVKKKYLRCLTEQLKKTNVVLVYYENYQNVFKKQEKQQYILFKKVMRFTN